MLIFNPVLLIVSCCYNLARFSNTISDGRWVHENRSVRLNEGDVVYYWLYMIVNGAGRQITDQR